MLEVKGVSHAYNNEKEIQFPDLHLDGNEHCLLLGKSGSGKTTLLHLIGGLLSAQKGAIKIADTILNQLSGASLDNFRGRHIGFIFQKPHLLKSVSVIENVLLAQRLAGMSTNNGRAKRMLSNLGIADIANKKSTEISQGQQQRVAVARALVNEPILILADEPTASLDDDNANAVLELLVSQANAYKASLIIATHDIRVKNRIDKCIEL